MRKHDTIFFINQRLEDAYNQSLHVHCHSQCHTREIIDGQAQSIQYWNSYVGRAVVLQHPPAYRVSSTVSRRSRSQNPLSLFCK